MTSEMNTINQQYNNYDHRIIKEVRGKEKLEHKLVRHRSTRTFNLRCLWEKEYPQDVRQHSSAKTILKQK